MPWQQLSILTTADHAEPLSDYLIEHGASAVTFLDAQDEPIFQLEPDTTPLWQCIKLQALFPMETPLPHLIGAMQNAFPALHTTDYAIETIEDEDWVRRTQQQFQPQCYGERLWIAPAWSTEQNLNGTVVRIDPGLAFGTGTHPTTALCLQWLVAYPPLEKTVIDYGCGSGILSLAALALGASHVIACDHDPQAIQATQNNAALNAFANNKNLQTVLPDAMPHTTADFIIANILANPLIALAPRLAQYARPGTQLILSGLLAQECAQVLVAYQSYFKHHETRTQENWALMHLERL